MNGERERERGGNKRQLENEAEFLGLGGSLETERGSSPFQFFNLFLFNLIIIFLLKYIFICFWLFPFSFFF